MNSTTTETGNGEAVATSVGLAGVPCPWPESVWPMNDAGYTVAVPSEVLRTAIGGYLMRKGWNLAMKRAGERATELESVLRTLLSAADAGDVSSLELAMHCARKAVGITADEPANNELSESPPRGGRATGTDPNRGSDSLR